MTVAIDTAKVSSDSIGLYSDDYAAMFEVLQRGDSVDRWIRKGSPDADVDCMEVANAMQCLLYVPEYQRICGELMRKYGVDEEWLVSVVLHHYATRTPTRPVC